MPGFLKHRDISTLFGISKSKEARLGVWLGEFLPITQKEWTVLNIFRNSHGSKILQIQQLLIHTMSHHDLNDRFHYVSNIYVIIASSANF